MASATDEDRKQMEALGYRESHTAFCRADGAALRRVVPVLVTYGSPDFRWCAVTVAGTGAPTTVLAVAESDAMPTPVAAAALAELRGWHRAPSLPTLEGPDD